MNLIVSYRKSLLKIDKPIVISNGRSEIYTKKFKFKNISGHVEYSSKNFSKHGTKAPMIINIRPGGEDYGPLDDTPVDKDEMKKELKRTKERERYIKLNPIQKSVRKSY